MTPTKPIRNPMLEECIHEISHTSMTGILTGCIMGFFLWGGIILALTAIFYH